jgi:hypothetical protein
MSRMEFEPTVPEFEWPTIVGFRSSEPTTTVIGFIQANSTKFLEAEQFLALKYSNVIVHHTNYLLFKLS